MPGLTSAGDDASRPRVEMRLVPRAELAGSPAPGQIVVEQALPRGTFTITREAGGRFLFDHAFYGAFAVTADGSAIACAPNDLPDWLWQRFLVAQPLPLAAVLNGLEPLHAGAVEIDGRAVLVSGTSGAGKTSALLHLVAGGARFLADDVSALELRDGVVVAHPGPPAASLDTAEVARLPGGAGVRWARLGVLEGEARLLVDPTATRPSPVGSVYVLRRGDADVDLTIGPPRLDPPKVLLGATFNAYVRDPARLARQLDIAARLAAAAAVREVRVPRTADAAVVARALARAERSSPSGTGSGCRSRPTS